MLGDHRAKTYRCLLEYIRRMVMKRFQKRKEECGKWLTELPPTVHSRIVKATKDSRLLRMLTTGNAEYKLLGETRAYVTKLNNNTCECGIWQISGVPCSHALAGIVSRRREPNEKPKESRSTCVVCTICKVPGHNKRTCKSGASTSQPRPGNNKKKSYPHKNNRVEVASSSQPQVLPPSNIHSQVTWYFQRQTNISLRFFNSTGNFGE
ncbi:hypothetical protein ACOSQ3_029945 [Xanthoceras sorbifolium]